MFKSLFKIRRSSRQVTLTQGFTLVELLIVISVIAILIAVLLPTLSSAREQANRIRCLSANRMVNLAIQGYQLEHKGWFPSEFTSAGSVLPTETTSVVGGVAIQNVLVDGQYTSKDVFTNKGCPEAPLKYSTGHGNVYYDSPPQGSIGIGISWLLQFGQAYTPQQTTSYWTRTPTFYSNMGPANDNWKRLSRRPDLVMTNTCSVNPIAHLDSSIRHTVGLPTPYHRVGFRHRGEVLPWLFYDGHGRLVKKNELDSIANPTLWVPNGTPYPMVRWSLGQMFDKRISGAMDR